MDHDEEIQTVILDDLFSSKFAIHDHDEDGSTPSQSGEPETSSLNGDSDSTEDGLAELLQVINAIKLLPASSKISYAVPGMFNIVNSHPIDTGAFFQVRKLDQPGHNRQIVAKYPRLDPARKGGGISRKNLEAIKLEIQALSHQPILDHPNIVDLLGFSWARLSADEERSHIVPVLLLEFASHGTLREYLSDNATSPAERLRLGKGLGEGLSALHKSGIVHGDLKLDNALVFDHPDGGVVAKLADFGSAVQLREGGYQYRGGTPPWTAPEWRKSIEPWEQHAADVYSFGLLIWTLCLEGRSPFPGLSLGEIEDRKMRDVIEIDAAKAVADHFEFVRYVEECSTELEQFELYVASVICPRQAFRYTLRLNPRDRDLETAVSALSVHGFYRSAQKKKKPSKSDESTALLRVYKSVNAYTKLTDMPEQVRKVMFRSFRATVEGDRISQREKAEMCLQIGLAHLDGFLDYSSTPAALPWLEKAAKLGSESARGVVYRIFRATGQSRLEQDPDLASHMRDYLVPATVIGSSVARRDLTDLDAEAARTATNTFLERFVPENMEGATTRLDKQIVEAVIGPRWQEGLSPAQRTMMQDQRRRMYLNRKLGSLLHFASAYGVGLESFEAFLDLEKPNIDAKDKEGNTPLLMAMRAGHGRLALALLQRGADPMISNDLGQTPCHWAIHVYDGEILEELISVMVSKEADLEKFARRKDVSDGRIYRQEEYEGTPLFWAILEDRQDLVSVLLKNGACPTTPGTYMSPFDLAVAFNSWQVIRLLSQFAQTPITSRIVGPTRTENLDGSKRIITEDWVSFAMFGSPRHYHMILHGPSHGEALKRTLLELRRAGLFSGDAPLEKALQSGGEVVSDLLWYQSCKLRPVSSWDLAELFMADATHISPDAASILLDRIAADEGSDPLPDMTSLLFIYPVSHRADVGIYSRLLDLINPDSVDIVDEERVTSYRHITPFMHSVLGGGFEFATELLRRGADPNFKTAGANSFSGTSAGVNILHLLILVNEDTSLAGLQYLLEPQHPFHDRKPDFVICEETGLTALTYAARWGNLLLFDYLSNHFDSSDVLDMRGLDNGDTALHVAAIHGNYDIVAALVNRGAKVNVLARTDEGKLKSPLDFCYDTDKFGTNIPRTSRHWEEVWIARLRTAKLLAAKGGLMLGKHPMPIGFNFLLHACSGNYWRLFEEALKHTPEALKSEAYLNALLFRAAEAGSEDVVGLLLDAGADVNNRSAKGQTALHRTALCGHMYTAKVLLQRGADPTLRDDKGRTAAIQAFTRDHVRLVTYLQSQGSPEDLPKMIEVPFVVDSRDGQTSYRVISTVCILKRPMTEGTGETEGQGEADEDDDGGVSSWVVSVRRDTEDGDEWEDSDDASVDLGESRRDPVPLTGMRGEGFHAAWKVAQERANNS